MNQFLAKLIGGAASGFLAAAMVDVRAWRKSGGTFDWGLALDRWATGALMGALGAFGIGAATGDEVVL